MRGMPGNFSALKPQSNLIVLTSEMVHVNTFHMNSIPPVIQKVRKVIATKLSPYFRQRPVIRRTIAIQLEFPWLSKR